MANSTAPALVAPQAEPNVEKMQQQFKDLRAAEPDAFVLLSALSILAQDEIRVPVESEMYAPLRGDLAFVTDEERFSKAIAALEKNKLATYRERTIILAPSITSSLPTFLDPTQRTAAVHSATHLLSSLFPRMEAHHSQLYTAWPTCSALMPHVNRLREAWKLEVAAAAEPMTTTTDVPNQTPAVELCQMLVEAARFLYETCDFDGVDGLCADILAVLGDDSGNDDDPAETKLDIRISALSQRANAAEIRGPAADAIAYNKQAYALRKSQKIPIVERIGGFEGNIGLNYDSAGQHTEAIEWHERARDTLEPHGLWGPTHLANMARCIMFLGELELAECLVDRAWGNFEKEEPRQASMMAFALFTKATIKRRSGDSATASKLYLEAHALWCKDSEGAALEQTKLHPFAGACLYKAGVSLMDQGNMAEAVKLLQESVDVTAPRADSMPAEAARSMLMLARASGEESDLWEGVAEVEGKVRAGYHAEADFDRAVCCFWR